MWAEKERKMFEYIISVTLTFSGDGTISKRTTRNTIDLVTLDVVVDGSVFDLVPDMDMEDDIEIVVQQVQQITNKQS